MKRIISLLLLLSICLCSCLVKEEETEFVPPELYVSEAIEQIDYVVAFRDSDRELAYEFDRLLAETIADGTAGLLSETHLGEDLICYDEAEPIEVIEEDGSLQRVREANEGKGLIKIGYHKQHQPMIWIDAAGRAVGFDAELAREICRRMGIPVEFVILEWHRAETALTSGQVDVVFSAFEYTPHRDSTLALSRKYMSTELVLVSPAERPVTSLDKLGKKQQVAMNEGSRAQGYAEQTEATPLYCPSDTNAYSRMHGNKCSAIITDRIFLSYIMKGLDKK